MQAKVLVPQSLSEGPTIMSELKREIVNAQREIQSRWRVTLAGGLLGFSMKYRFQGHGHG